MGRNSGRYKVSSNYTRDLYERAIKDGYIVGYGLKETLTPGETNHIMMVVLMPEANQIWWVEPQTGEMELVTRIDGVDVVINSTEY